MRDRLGIRISSRGIRRGRGIFGSVMRIVLFEGLWDGEGGRDGVHTASDRVGEGIEKIA